MWQEQFSVFHFLNKVIVFPGAQLQVQLQTRDLSVVERAAKDINFFINSYVKLFIQSFIYLYIVVYNYFNYFVCIYQWEAFSLPELENFLCVLNREEDEYIEQMKTKFRLKKLQLQKRLKEKEPSDQRTPIFV